VGNWQVWVEPGAVGDWMHRTDPDTSEQIELVLWTGLILPSQRDAPPVIGKSPRGLPLVQATTHTEAEIIVIPYPSGPPYGLIIVNRFY
jgi:hypothetical protein